MKAIVSGDMQVQALLVLTPESEDERRVLEKLAQLTGSVCIVNHRGFRYMSPDVEFLVQTKPRSD